MYQLKSVARRLVLFVPILGMLGAMTYQAIAPGASLADALNPLTKRSLLLTSSSPGWAYTDGSGNSTYAPPGSGPNGQKTGETFTFDTSSDNSSAAIEAFTLQYCMKAAGYCLAPGDDAQEPYVGSGSGCGAGNAFVCPANTAGVPNYTDDTSHTDFNVVSGNDAGTSYAISSLGTGWTEGGAVTSNAPATSGGDFAIYYYDGTNWHYSSGWTMKVGNVEDSSQVTDPTGANNYIQLLNSSGLTIPADTEVEVQFAPSASNYITNPGSQAFFVKINDYETTSNINFSDNEPYVDTCGGTSPNFNDCPDNVTDGGVTVAQVMNQSIEIQTKVLETMDFSVGTVDPDTLSSAALDTDWDTTSAAHGQCDSLLGYNAAAVTGWNPSVNTILLGDPTAEYSLSTTTPYDANSLYRVSTNAANGATVYYSGNTLSDTEGNHIQGMTDSPTLNDAAFSDSGTEQFGLGLEYASTAILSSANDYYLTTDNGGNSDEVPYTGSLDSGFTTDLTSNSTSPYWYTPTLSPLLPEPSYGSANGSLASGSGPKFAFNATANTIPVPIASEDQQVVNCSTGDVRYVADIAPSTPAGIYTTAINYLAAPEY